MSDTVTAMQTITFDTIPYSILRPQVIIEVAANYSQIGLLPFPATILAMGQMTATGTAQPLTSYQIQPGDQAALFGAPSPLADQLDAIFANNGTQPVFAIGGLPPAGSAAATSTVTFSGGASAYAGTLPFLVGDRPANTIINLGDGATIQAASFAGVVNADPLMHVTAVAVAGVVTLTVKYPGAAGNSIRVRLSDGTTNAADFVAGTVVVVADAVNGTGVPVASAMLAAVEGDWRTDIALGFTDPTTLAEVAADLEARYAAAGRRDGHAYYCSPLTVGQALAAAPANSRFMSRLPYVGQSAPWKVSAALCGVAAFQLTNDPARQLRTLPLVGILPPDAAQAPSDFEREELLGSGWSTLETLSDGTVTIERIVTCYTTSALGIPDPAWRDIMRPKTMTRIRWDFGNYLGLVWPRAKLTDDGSVASIFDPKIATPRRLANSWAARCTIYAQQGWIESLDTTLKQSVFVRDPNDRNRVNSRLVVNQVGNLMVFAGRLECLV